MRFSTNKTLVLALALAIFAVGCGDDDGGESGTGGTGGSGGSSGTSGSGGSGGTAGTGMVDMTCGSVTCPEFPELMVPDAGGGGGLLGGALSGFITPPEHCCTDPGNACGVANDTLLNANACLERDVPGQENDVCTVGELEISSFGITLPLPGCCRPDGKCGFNASLGGMSFGTGCAEREELATAMAGSMASMFFTVPAWESIACTYVPEMDGGVEEDAGN